MSIEVHRANKVFLPHYTVLLNQLNSEVKKLIRRENWEFIVSGYFMEFQELAVNKIERFFELATDTKNQTLQISEDEIEKLRDKGKTDEQIEILIESLREGLKMINKVLIRIILKIS